MKIIDSVFVYRLAEGDRLIHHGRYHSHGDDEFEIHFFVDGSGSFLFNKTRYHIGSNSLFLVGPHAFHSIVPKEISRPLTYYAILFQLSTEDDAFLYQILLQALDSEHRCKTVDLINKFNFEEISRLALSDISELRFAGMHLLLSHLYRWYAGLSIDELRKQSGLKKKNQYYVQKVVTIMENNLSGTVSVEQLAYRIGLSAEHFIRIFKDEIKMTPYQYFTRLKIQAASTELIATNKTIAQIAEAFSFENQFHFSRVFKKCTGFSPSEYKKLYSFESK